MRTTNSSQAGRLRPAGRALLRTGLLGLAVLVISSCAAPNQYAYQGPPPVRISQIVRWSKTGVAPVEIIARLKRSETVYNLTSSQIVHLAALGVSTEVLDYMQETYAQAIRRDQSLQDQQYWALYADGYLYGGPYYWPWPDVTFAYGGPPVYAGGDHDRGRGGYEGGHEGYGGGREGYGGGHEGGHEGGHGGGGRGDR